ncbi:MAG: response regulator transcription factor, partial [Lachnospiraceae bacterium]
MKKILIVEDNTQINSMTNDFLCKKQFDCVQAFSGTEALLHLKSQNFDTIILDLMLLGISGNKLIEKIKPKIKTPIIVLSAKDELDTKVNSLMLGADDYITKPFELEELYARISVQLRKSSQQLHDDALTKYKDLVIS